MGKKKKQTNPAFALDVGIEQGTGEEEVGALIEIPAGDNAALYISEVFEESESWASIKQVDVDGERLIHAETYVPETADWAIVEDASLPVVQEEWLLPDQESGSALIGELQAEVSQAIASPAGFASNAGSLDPMYRLFIEQASDPELDWAEADVILDEEAGELVMVIPSVGTVLEEQALWPRTTKPFIDDGRSVVVRAPVVKVTVPDKPKPVVQVKKDVTTNKPVINSVNRTSNYREPFEYCPHQYYGALTRFTAPLCSQWEEKQAPKVNKITTDAAKKAIVETSKFAEQNLNLSRKVVGLVGKDAALILAGFENLTTEQIDGFYKGAVAPSNNLGTNAAISSRRDFALSPEDLRQEIANGVGTACSALSLLGLLGKVASGMCGVGAGLIGAWPDGSLERAFLVSALQNLVSPPKAIEDLNRSDMVDFVRAFQNNQYISQEQKAELQRFMDHLNSALAASGLQDTAEELIGSAIFGLIKLYDAVNPEATNADILLSVKGRLEQLVQALGPQVVILLDGAYRLFESQAFSTDFGPEEFESQIPFKIAAELKWMIDSLEKLMSKRNAAALTTYLAATAQQLVKDPTSLEAQEAAARGGFLLGLNLKADQVAKDTNDSLLNFKVFYQIPVGVQHPVIDFYLTPSIKTSTGTFSFPERAHVFGKVEPYLGNGLNEVDDILDDIRRVSDAIDAASSQILDSNAGFANTGGASKKYIIQVIDEAAPGQMEALCNRLAQEPDLNKTMVIINNQVQCINTQNNFTLQEAQAVCEQTLKLCAPEQPKASSPTDNFPSTLKTTTNRPSMLQLTTPEYVNCSTSSQCFTPISEPIMYH